MFIKEEQFLWSYIDRVFAFRHLTLASNDYLDI